MQNPVWKLTALAGVIGIGFLIVYQAQTASDAVSLNSAEQQSLDEADLTTPESNADRLPPNEPDASFLTMQSEPGADPLFPGNTSSVPADDSSLFDDNYSGVTASGMQHEPDFGGDLLPAPVDTPELDPFLAESPLSPDPGLLPESASLSLADQTAIVPTDAVATSTQPVDSARQQAMQLMEEARAAIENGQLRAARAKAISASALPVIYDAFEQRPADLVVEIDDLIAAAGRKIQTIEPAAKPQDNSILPVAGQLPGGNSLVTPPSLDALREPRTGLGASLGDSVLNEPPVQDDPFATDNIGLDSPTGLTDEPFAPMPLEPADSTEPASLEPFSSDPFAGQSEPLSETNEPAPAATPAESLSPPVSPLEFSPEIEPLDSTPGLDTPALDRAGPEDPLAGDGDLLPETASLASPVNIAATADPMLGNIALPANVPQAAQQPRLSIEKIAPPDAVIGKPIIYSINITNHGNSAAANLVVEDHIPKGCRLVGTIPQAELTGTRLLWRRDRLAAGEEFKVLIKVIPVEQGKIGSVATVNFKSEVAARTDVHPEETPRLTFRTTAPEFANLNQPITFHFEVANRGNTDLHNVKLQNLIPVGLVHPAGKDLTYEIGTIAAGKTFEVDLEMKPTSSGTHSNRAIIRADGGLSVESIRSVKVIEQKLLSIKTTSNGPIMVGETSTQDITVTNGSDSPVGNAEMSLVLAEGLRFTSATSSGQYDQTSRTVSWTLPVLQPGKSLTLSVSSVPTRFGVHSSSVKIKHDGQTARTVSEVEARGIAALKLELENVPATVNQSDEFTIDVTIRNRGNGPDNNVGLSLSIPAELEFVSARGPVRNNPPAPANNGNRVSFISIPEMGEQATVDFQITLRARRSGRPKIHSELTSTQLGQPIISEAAVFVIGNE